MINGVRPQLKSDLIFINNYFMNIFKQYKEYLHDNPQGYWFKRKLYGWGWTPAKWQGWAVIAGFIILLMILISRRGSFQTEGQFLALFFLLLLILLLITYSKGEKPKWQWGLKKDTIKDFF